MSSAIELVALVILGGNIYALPISVMIQPGSPVLEIFINGYFGAWVCQWSFIEIQGFVDL